MSRAGASRGTGVPGRIAEAALAGSFHDGKEATAFRTIGEVASALGIRAHVLRYWEEQFPTLRPLTRAGGRRYYRPEDVALVAEIDRLVHREGYTIRGARQALAGKGEGRGTPGAQAQPGQVRVLPAQEAHEPAMTAAAATSAQGIAGGEEDRIIAALRVLCGELHGVRDRLRAALAEDRD